MTDTNLHSALFFSSWQNPFPTNEPLQPKFQKKKKSKILAVNRNSPPQDLYKMTLLTGCKVFNLETLCCIFVACVKMDENSVGR